MLNLGMNDRRAADQDSILSQFGLGYIFRDRRDGGRALADKLARFANRSDVMIFGLPRGGVIVADEVAKELKAPLDVFVVRKLGTPGHRELAMGAIASGGVCVINKKLVDALHVPAYAVDQVMQQEFEELERRESLYRGEAAPMIQMQGMTAIVVDDGVATGSTMLAALRAARACAPKWLIAAAPVASQSTCLELSHEADEIICAATPEPFHSVGQWYENFDQTTDEEVRACLSAQGDLFHI